MAKRRLGREAAIQFLYSRDVGGAGSSAEDLDAFWTLHETGSGSRQFADSLIAGTLQHLEAIDARLAGAARNFRVERFAATDRNILRVAVYEMLFSGDTPPRVAMNEAIEIAKRFGGTDSHRFVNGVLDRILQSEPAPDGDGGGGGSHEAGSGTEPEPEPGPQPEPEPDPEP